MPLITQEQLTQEWFDAHHGRITGSVAAACLRLNPYEGAVAAYRKIMGITKKATNHFMQWGNDHEDRAVSTYECVTGNLCEKTGFWVHPIHDWLGASPDRLVMGTRGGAETKCPNKLVDRVPLEHRIQCQIEMYVAELDWIDYFSWTPEGHYLERIENDDTFAAKLVASLQAFYLDYICKRVEPPLRGPLPSWINQLETLPVDVSPDALADMERSIAQALDALDPFSDAPMRSEFQD